MYLNVHTSWDYQSRSVMICGFKEPTMVFTRALDDVMQNVTARMVGVLNRYVTLNVDHQYHISPSMI